MASNKDKADSTRVPDRIKQTLESPRGVMMYDWMFDTGLHQADLLVYACMFNELRDTPNTPQRVNMSEIARRIHYSPSSVHFSVDMLVEHGFLYSRGSRMDTVYSLYPITKLF